MPGRHASGERRPRRKLWRGLVIVVAVALVPVVAFVGARAISLGQGDQAASGCSGTKTMHIAVAPEMAPPMWKITDEVDSDNVSVDGKCLKFVVVPAKPADVYSLLTGSVSDNEIDLWIPDTLEWVQRSEMPTDRVMALSPSVAASPLVVGTSQQTADQLSDDDKANWQSLADSTDMMISDPEKSGVALSALLGIQRTIVGAPTEESASTSSDERNEMGEAILGMLNNEVYDLTRELDESAGAEGLTGGVPASEQRLLSYAERNAEADLVPIMPNDGTLLLDYPLIAVMNKGAEREAQIQAGTALMQHVDSDSGQASLRKAGFRSFPELAPPSSSTDIGEVELLHETVAGEGDEVMRNWAAVNMESRILSIVDLSGSMDFEVDGDGRTRAELARDSAKSALGYMPNTARLGLWGFSQNRDGDADYEQLLPIAPLDNPHREAFENELDQFPSLTYGGTGLYDTFLAGYEAALDGYDPARRNALVLLSDGANEDDGISKPDLLARLKQLTTPDRPVSTILVGIGPDADMEELEELAAATGGRAERASTPEDMDRIILDALLLRQCEQNFCD